MISFSPNSSNAEFVRILHSELSWQRMVFVIGIALLILFLLHLEEALGDGFYRVWFMVFAAGWGSFSLIWSIKEDMSNRTWYWLIMLPLTPLQLLGGRLCGVLFLPWLAGLLVMLPLLFSGGFLLLLLFAMLINVVALFLALVTVRDGKAQVTIPVILTLIFTVALFNYIEELNIFSSEFGGLFIDLTFALYIGWGLIGCYRLLANAKQYPAQPLWWWGFLLFHLGYGGICYFNNELKFLNFENSGDGFYNPINPEFWGLLWTLSWIVLYICAFLIGSRGLLIFIDHLRRRDRWWLYIPPWAGAVVFIWLTVLLYFLISTSGQYYPLMVMVAFSFLALRDIAILFIFTLRPGGKLPEGITIVIMIALYWLLPFLFNEIGIGAHWMAFSTESFRKIPPDNELIISLCSAAVQFALALYGLWHLRLRHFWHSNNATRAAAFSAPSI